MNRSHKHFNSLRVERISEWHWRRLNILLEMTQNPQLDRFDRPHVPSKRISSHLEEQTSKFAWQALKGCEFLFSVSLFPLSTPKQTTRRDLMRARKRFSLCIKFSLKGESFANQRGTAARIALRDWASPAACDVRLCTYIIFVAEVGWRFFFHLKAHFLFTVCALPCKYTSHT